MYFKYKAMNEVGRMVSGELEADNPEDLEARLERMELDMISFSERRRRKGSGKRINRKELITFCIYMEQLLNAGVPLLQGLKDLRNSLPESGFRDIIASLIEDVEAGKQLSWSMKRFPAVFNTVFISLVHVGEESGELSRVFQHLTESLKWQDEIVEQTKKLLMYPSFAAATIIGMVMFMMLFLVPQTKEFMLNMVGELPLETQILVSLSDFFVEWWLLILLFPFVLLVSIWLIGHFSLRGRFLIDRQKLRVWVIGPILQKIILARFASFFALMYSSGITVIESLIILQKTAGNLAIETALEEVRQQIVDGSSISDSFTQSKLFPPLVLRMIQMGEATGKLDEALLNVSYFYDREIRESIGKLQAMIEPMMILTLGLIMGLLIMAVLGPIYDVAIGNANSM